MALERKCQEGKLEKLEKDQKTVVRKLDLEEKCIQIKERRLDMEGFDILENSAEWRGFIGVLSSLSAGVY